MPNWPLRVQRRALPAPLWTRTKSSSKIFPMWVKNSRRGSSLCPQPHRTESKSSSRSTLCLSRKDKPQCLPSRHSLHSWVRSKNRDPNPVQVLVVHLQLDTILRQWQPDRVRASLSRMTNNLPVDVQAARVASTLWAAPTAASIAARRSHEAARQDARMSHADVNLDKTFCDFLVWTTLSLSNASSALLCIRMAHSERVLLACVCVYVLIEATYAVSISLWLCDSSFATRVASCSISGGIERSSRARGSLEDRIPIYFLNWINVKYALSLHGTLWSQLFSKKCYNFQRHARVALRFLSMCRKVLRQLLSWMLQTRARLQNFSRVNRATLWF